jgi:hypothetical protein
MRTRYFVWYRVGESSPEIRDEPPCLNRSEAMNRLTVLIRTGQALTGRVRVEIVNDIVSVRGTVAQARGKSIE